MSPSQDLPAQLPLLDPLLEANTSRSLRVLLVYSNRSRILEPAPPIGLSYVASATREAGHQVRVVDLMVSHNPHAALRQALADFQPEVAGISVRNIDTIVAQQVAWHLDIGERLGLPGIGYLALSARYFTGNFQGGR